MNNNNNNSNKIKLNFSLATIWLLLFCCLFYMFTSENFCNQLNCRSEKSLHRNPKNIHGKT